MSGMTWREIARQLAERLEHQAALAGTGDGCTHSLNEADPDNCPFCADRAAFLRWQRREQRVRALDRARRKRARALIGQPREDPNGE